MISGNSVKCQKCGLAVPIVGKLARPHSTDRIAILEKRIRWTEKRYQNSTNIKKLKDELAELLKEE
ncbi:MAG: hypothetical protein ACJ72S_07295, partial [Nitrososphaeraceae archaeon]